MVLFSVEDINFLGSYDGELISFEVEKMFVSGRVVICVVEKDVG